MSSAQLDMNTTPAWQALLVKLTKAGIKSFEILYTNDLDRGPFVSDTLRVDPSRTELDALVDRVVAYEKSRRVEVELVADDGELRLSHADDGRGGAGAPGNGLAGMRERLAAFGAGLEVDSPPGAGTRLQITLPRRALEASA